MQVRCCWAVKPKTTRRSDSGDMFFSMKAQPRLVRALDARKHSTAWWGTSRLFLENHRSSAATAASARPPRFSTNGACSKLMGKRWTS